MIIPYACKVAVHNPSDEGQVRRVSGAGSPTWDNLEDSTADNLITPAAIAGTASFELSWPPAGLSVDLDYRISVFAADATDAKGTPLDMGTVWGRDADVEVELS